VRQRPYPLASGGVRIPSDPILLPGGRAGFVSVRLGRPSCPLVVRASPWGPERIPRTSEPAIRDPERGSSTPTARVRLGARCLAVRASCIRAGAVASRSRVRHLRRRATILERERASRGGERSYSIEDGQAREHARAARVVASPTSFHQRPKFLAGRTAITHERASFRPEQSSRMLEPSRVRSRSLLKLAHSMHLLSRGRLAARRGSPSFDFTHAGRPQRRGCRAICERAPRGER